jgi:hypothetical protein
MAIGIPRFPGWEYRIISAWLKGHIFYFDGYSLTQERAKERLAEAKEPIQTGFTQVAARNTN